jgi:protein dithiol oxidoreductase (disulfide-forming)
MALNRRRFALQLSGLAAAACGAPLAQAQVSPVLGTHYARLSQQGPVVAPAGKVEVAEFFMYSCPHCNALEPSLETWAKTLPAEVVLRRVPVAFNPSLEPHQRIFYALESMGQLEAMHRKVFAAIHVDRKRLDKEADIVAFMKASGVDAAKFTEAYNSFTVQTRVRQAKQATEAYRIESVPTFFVGGRYMTSVGQAGSEAMFFGTLNFLIQQTRAGK